MKHEAKIETGRGLKRSGAMSLVAALTLSLWFHAALALLVAVIRFSSFPPITEEMHKDRAPIVAVSIVCTPAAAAEVPTQPTATVMQQPEPQLPAAPPARPNAVETETAPLREEIQNQPVETTAKTEASPAPLENVALATPDTSSAEQRQQTPSLAATPHEPRRSRPLYGTRAAVLREIKPAYPAQAVRGGIEGSVLLSVKIESSGTASEVNVATSSGHRELDGAAARAVERWKFRPAITEGKPVASMETVLVKFKLEN